jgi:FAD/FMN-containing dehydrogenase
LQPRSPLEPCAEDFASAGCSQALQTLKNPYALQDDPGATESLGFLGAWDAAPSEYAVVAETAQDIAVGVRFARDHGLKLVVKGTGHDYLGRSSAPQSFLLWTHRMRRISVHDAFVPAGCPAATPPSPAITVEAGTRWLEAYQAAGKHGRYVSGGGCMSVGVAGGFLQGGGFGPWSNAYGISAAGLLEAQVVTADGVIRVANPCQNADLFWALRGGGGGTFGVVTEVTLLTYPAPASMGFAVGELRAKDDASYQELLRRFFAFYRSDLTGPTWGGTSWSGRGTWSGR